MDIGLTLLVAAIGLTINCLIMYYVTRASARSAVEEALSQLALSDTVAKELRRIRELLEKPQRLDAAASAVQPSVASAPKSDYSGAYLTVEGEDRARCSVCGKEQRANRTVCLSCGARFALANEDAGQTKDAERTL